MKCWTRSGLRCWRGRVLDEKWTEGEVLEVEVLEGEVLKGECAGREDDGGAEG